MESQNRCSHEDEKNNVEERSLEVTSERADIEVRVINSHSFSNTSNQQDNAHHHVTSSVSLHSTGIVRNKMVTRSRLKSNLKLKEDTQQRDTLLFSKSDTGNVREGNGSPFGGKTIKSPSSSNAKSSIITRRNINSSMKIGLGGKGSSFYQYQNIFLRLVTHKPRL